MEQTESEVSELQNQYTNLIKEIVICERSYHGRITKVVREAERTLVKMFETGEYEGPINQISTKLKQDLKNEGFTPSQLDNIHRIVQPEHRDPKFKSSHLTASEFDDLEESVFDQTEEFSQRTLSDKQLDKLSEAERREVLEQEINTRKSRKTIDNDRIKHLQEYADNKGITLVEKVSKALPPENLRGQSEVYSLLGEGERQFYNMGDMFKDLKQQTYNFKPNKETQEKAIAELEQWQNNVLNPFLKIAIQYLEGFQTIMRNITDEKYSETNRGWMKMAEDKFWAYGNHGSGEVNAVLTNRVILKLGFREFKDEDTEEVLKVLPVLVYTPVKREGTREEMGDKCICEPQGQLEIVCPNCNFEFNRPYLPDDQRDLIAGDLFHQAKNILLNDGLSNAIDALANNVVTEQIQDPIEWFKEEFNRQKGRYPTEQEIKDLIIEEGKAEKIKTVDIDEKDVVERRHGMLRNIATRRADKAEHFSGVS